MFNLPRLEHETGEYVSRCHQASAVARHFSDAPSAINERKDDIKHKQNQF